MNALEIQGYRSIRQLRLRLGSLNVLVGPNGSGKTNLYRGLMLLQAAAEGRFAATLVAEGGIPSVLWAGTRGKGPVRMTIGVELEGLVFELAAGIIPPVPGKTMFNLDPHVKEEHLWLVEKRRRVELMERKNATAWLRDDEGNRVTFPLALPETESVLSELREPHRFAVLSAVRQEFLAWRFYHQFRTDLGSPIREPQIGCRTPVLAQDGHDLAAALRTIIEIGDAGALTEAIDRAFPGSELIIECDRGRFSFALLSPDFARPFEARELSDGTLQYLCLLAALLSPRPPTLLALNEPETSIHPDLLEPLAELITRASRDSQIWVTTHSRRLAKAIAASSGCAPIALRKVAGATCLEE